MTPDQSKTRVRRTAIAGTALALAGVAVAVAAHPYPQSTAAKDPTVVALQRREAALAKQAAQVTAANNARWATYRTQLASRQKQIAAANAAAAQAAQAAPSASYVASAPVASTRTS